jgi:predicted MFS family arabinose efflux permease
MQSSVPEHPCDLDDFAGETAPVAAAIAEPPHGLSRSFVLLLSVTCGVTVANLYYNQPLLRQMADTFGASAAEVGLIPTVTQIGYAVGLFFIVPLGDMGNRRRLVTVLMVLVTGALVFAALANSLVWLAVASLAIGITTVVPQVLIPLAAQMSPPERRGKTVGTVMSGVLTGILLSRTLSGFVGQHLGWRSVYWMAAGLMVAFLVVLRALMPHHPARQSMTYAGLLRSLAQLARRERTLQQAALNGALLFACFSAFWATLVFRLAAPPFHYGAQVAGLFGVVGAAGALVAPLTGRLADRVGPRRIITLASAGMLLSFVLLYALGTTLAGLVVGVLLLDVVATMGMISNQTRIYSLPRDVHSRVNTVYMVCYFLGGATGSFLGTFAWNHWQWPGVCAVGAAISLVALIVHLAWRAAGSNVQTTMTNP